MSNMRTERKAGGMRESRIGFKAGRPWFEIRL